MMNKGLFSGKKVEFITLGCKLNFAESSAIGRTLAEAGFTRCGRGEQAEVVIVNTCSVTDVADKKGRQAIHRAVRQHPGAYVVVTGCYAQLKPEAVAAIEGVDLVLGANEKVSLPDFLDSMEKKRGAAGCRVSKYKDISAFRPICSADDRTRHFLKVQDGCDYFCSYCTIPFARGRSRSATVAETVAVAEQTIADGAKEIVLTGVNTGDFGRSSGETFFDLIRALDAVEAEVRYRISSIEPNLLTDGIIEFVAQSRHFAPHFHMPLQSGSDTVLRLMRRRYDAALFAENAVRGKPLFNEPAHGELGPLVGFGHGSAVVFVVDMNAGEKFFPNHGKSRIDELMKKWNEFFFFLRRCRHCVGLPHSICSDDFFPDKTSKN